MSGVRLRCRAPGKVNPLVAVGAAGPDGRHDQVLVLQAVDLADTVELRDGPGVRADEVRCAGVDGQNLALEAIRALRAATGWDGPPVRVDITKRIPVAAGMAGGSADAGAALRLCAAHVGGVSDATLADVAARLGADVPHGVLGGLALAAERGGRTEVLAAPGELTGGCVLLPDAGLSTGAVYAEADRDGVGRTAADLDATTVALRAALPAGDGLGSVPWACDLQAAACRLAPRLRARLDALRAAGARHALVSGSGPTTFGWFADPDAAARAANGLRAEGHAAHAVAACDAGAGRVEG